MEKGEEEEEEDRKTLHSMCKKLSEDMFRKVCPVFRLHCTEDVSIYCFLTKNIEYPAQGLHPGLEIFVYFHFQFYFEINFILKPK